MMTTMTAGRATLRKIWSDPLPRLSNRRVRLIFLPVLMMIGLGWDGSLRGLPVTVAAPTNFSSVGSGLLELRPIAFAQAGLLVLLATPVSRALWRVVGPVVVAPDEAIDAQEPGQAAQARDERQEED